MAKEKKPGYFFEGAFQKPSEEELNKDNPLGTLFPKEKKKKV